MRYLQIPKICSQGLCDCFAVVFLVHNWTLDWICLRRLLSAGGCWAKMWVCCVVFSGTAVTASVLFATRFHRTLARTARLSSASWPSDKSPWFVCRTLYFVTYFIHLMNTIVSHSGQLWWLKHISYLFVENTLFWSRNNLDVCFLIVIQQC